uniref:Transforming growth factor, alpha n=1 Tax=Echeneis naucrates TaxID=173247 RepID=A0A665VIG6_ECHNA
DEGCCAAICLVVHLPSHPKRHTVASFVAAAVRSHFDDCPDSHRHFCFHGTFNTWLNIYTNLACSVTTMTTFYIHCTWGDNRLSPRCWCCVSSDVF